MFEKKVVDNMELIKEKKLAAGLSITSNAIIIILKFIAGSISGSISIISEAIHSMSDFLASVLTFFAVMKSSEPADKTHPFGHGKYEDMSGFIEGGLIVFAGIFIIWEACKKLFFHQTIEVDTSLGIMVMLFAVVANILVSSYLFKIAKKSESVSLHADGEHLRTDVYSSLGVLLGLVLIKVTGIAILDPIIAILVAIFVLKAGFVISKDTLNNLLDGTLPTEDIEAIKTIINSYNNECLRGFKNLKARRSGPLKDIEVTMLFPEDMTISDCHKICDDVEKLLEKRLGNCDILIHAEPEVCSKTKL